MENNFKWGFFDIRLVAAVLSLLLSAFMAATGWLPNEDAFTYIRTVEIFNDEGLLAAFRHYPWATYALLIAAVHNLLTIEPFTAALIVNALFYSLLVYSFISLVAEIDSDRHTLLLAALIVLVYPQLNEYRLVIIRDSAFWALALFGIWQFVLYTKSRRAINGIVFIASLLLASTFRLEALVLLFSVPGSLLVSERHQVRNGLGQIAFFIGASTIAVLLMALVLSSIGLNVIQLIAEQFAGYVPLINNTFSPTEQQTADVGRAIFGDYAVNFSGDYLGLFMFAGLFALLLAFLFRGFGGPFLVLLVAGVFMRAWRWPGRQAAPLMLAGLVSGLIAFGFLLATRFLSTRYVMPVCLFMIVFIPPLLTRMLVVAEEKGYAKTARRLLAFLLFYCAVDAYISFGADRDYLREAGNWIAQNSQESTVLLTNNRLVAYYSQRVADYDDLNFAFTESDILQLESGALVGFEVDTSTVGLFERESLRNAVQEILRFGDESGRQLVLYRRL